jgi:hypothetical protein
MMLEWSLQNVLLLFGTYLLSLVPAFVYLLFADGRRRKKDRRALDRRYRGPSRKEPPVGT